MALIEVNMSVDIMQIRNQSIPPPNMMICNWFLSQWTSRAVVRLCRSWNQSMDRGLENCAWTSLRGIMTALLSLTSSNPFALMIAGKLHRHICIHFSGPIL